jgi:hypothetical protein
MRFFRLGLSVATVLAMSGILQAATRIRAVHPERMEMSETRRRDLVLGDLISVLTGPTSPTAIATERYASSEAGLCKRDVIQLKYENKRDDRADAPVQPIGIQAVSVQYHYLGPENDRSRLSLQKACERLSNKNSYWAYGDDEHYSASALAMLKFTEADVRNGQRYTIDCGELASDPIQTTCENKFLSASTQISAIWRCPDRKDGCYEFTSFPYRFTIYRSYSPSLGGGYSTAIKMGYEPIVVT